MDRAVFERRRQEVMQLMGEGVAVIPTAPERYRNRDVLYPYRPDSDFFYLTHYPEPEAVAVLCPGRAQGEFIVFCRDRDPEREIWDGKRAGVKGVVEQYQADDAFPIDDIDDILPGILENRSKVFCNVGSYPEFDIKLLNWVNEVKAKARTGVHAPSELVDLNHILHELRLVKRTEEVNIMKRAARVSADAHVRAMQTCQPGMMEYEIQAELEYEFRKGGGMGVAYPPIVAGGANACVLHYVENNQELKKGDLLLIDAATEIDCYAADITRTFPVNGKFTAEQKTLYEIVLAAQTAAIEKADSGNHWNEPHDAAVRVLVDGLIDLQLLDGTVDDQIENGGFRRFYMHRTGHWLGMDVHDVGDYKVEDEWRELEPGMTFTVEPGVYIPDADDIDPRWRNIGIRIEDDVLINRQGNTVLSKDVPKTVDDIEALMAS
ncbi:MAG: aminopeptidase P N-terminal domain-containing protein [Gammaproteobacteria bacterium]|nr:aminopeptidase P N-terminal domain-containing protein [Gammaproteobacteria bacterium]